MAVSSTSVLRPRGLSVEQLGANRARVVVEPLERGFGHTLGNALRRVLLSSIPGSAIVEVEIDGVLHEYTTLEGLQEDVIEVLLNLKEVAIRQHSGDEVTLTLSKKGKGVVTAGDIVVDHTVEIVNPEHVLCHLTKDVALNMRLKVRRGVGYEPASARQHPDDEARPIGRLQLDASFAPVLRVAYEVDAARVEQRTNLDKLVLDVETNGTIDAEEAVRKAAEIINDQLSVFGDFSHRESATDQAEKSGFEPSRTCWAGVVSPWAPSLRTGRRRVFRTACSWADGFVGAIGFIGAIVLDRCIARLQPGCVSRFGWAPKAAIHGREQSFAILLDRCVVPVWSAGVSQAWPDAKGSHPWPHAQIRPVASEAFDSG